MYHPTRGGVRGGRDQFKWDDVKVDKHRENYVGHSIKAPVGRWQKGKDLFWYTRDKKSEASDMGAVKEEIRRIKEEEEQAMREALGLAPKRANRPQGNRLDKHEYAELVKRGSTAEDLGAGHAEAAQVQGLGLYKLPCNQTESSFLPGKLKDIAPDRDNEAPKAQSDEEVTEEESRKKRHREEETEEESRKKRHREEETEEERRKKRHREERREGKEKRREKHKRKGSDEYDDKRKHRREKEKRRHDSD